MCKSRRGEWCASLDSVYVSLIWQESIIVQHDIALNVDIMLSICGATKL